MNTAAQKESDLDHTPLKFGKYKGKTPDEVAEVDPSYIVWMHKNVKDYPTCSKALARACKEDLETDSDDLEEDKMMADSFAHAQYGSWGQG